jgi:hypothetical protein
VQRVGSLKELAGVNEDQNNKFSVSEHDLAMKYNIFIARHGVVAELADAAGSKLAEVNLLVGSIPTHATEILCGSA